MLDVQRVVLPPDNTYPFFVTAKRYTHPASFAHRRSTDAGTSGPSALALPPASSPTAAPTSASPSASAPPLTLLLLHSTSFCKEVYEPILRDLWARTAAKGDLPIREAWAVECPNHGESAVLNAETLRQPPFNTYCRFHDS